MCTDFQEGSQLTNDSDLPLTSENPRYQSPPISPRVVGERESERELARFLSIAAGSASETQYQILLAHDLGYLKNDEYGHLSTLVTEVKRMLYSLHQKVSAKNRKADS